MPSTKSFPIYSIQQTYIIKPVSKSEKHILTCDERIDIPTIEPLTHIKVVGNSDFRGTVIPCIELVSDVLSELDLTFETNEGVTVLPIVIKPGQVNPYSNPYNHPRFVLVLPRGTTGVKSCKLFAKGSNIEIQHNFTFGIMPPPYNYDNALFGYTLSDVLELHKRVSNLYEDYLSLNDRVTALENKAGG